MEKKGMPIFLRRFYYRLFRPRWFALCMLSVAINCLLLIWTLFFISKAADQSNVVGLPSFGRPAEAVPGRTNTRLPGLVTVVMIEFEQFENDLEETLGDLCTQIPGLNVLVISDRIPYPPLRLPAHTECHIRLLNTQPDVRQSLFHHRPEYQITTDYTLFIPDCTRVSSQMLLPQNLKLSHVRPNQILAIPIMHLNEDIDFQYECLSVHFDFLRWTLRFEERLHEHHLCEALTGEFAFLMHSTDLLHMSMPFERPFPMSLYVQAKLHNLTIVVDEDLKFYKSRVLFSGQDERPRAKAEQLNSARLHSLFRRFGVKKVIESDGQVHWFGCNKHTPRCFASIVQDTPDYLHQGRWTPPCCLENLKLLAHHVFDILERCQVRYWLEGGTLLGAVRSGEIIPWDYDLDVGFYREDAVKCRLLNLTLKGSSPVKDDRNYLWERAVEGDFLRVHFSPTNRLHLDLFPFHPMSNGMMTKNSWFADHVQDKEFPESFLKPLEKMMFLGRQVSVPNSARDFLEYKFGAGVIEHPQYPKPELLPQFNVTKADLQM